MYEELTGSNFQTACHLHLSYLKEQDFCLKISLSRPNENTKFNEVPKNCHVFKPNIFDQVRTFLVFAPIN